MQRSKVPVAETGLALPPDVVEEILLRVPARQLRRFRAVCRSWRSFLSDQSFVKAHAASRPALILAHAANDYRINVVEFSGHAVKQIRIRAVEEEVMPPPHPGPSFLFRANNRIRMVELDTGALFTLPFDDFDKLTLSFIRSVRTDYVLGQVTSTGHQKVLRIFTGIAKPHSDSSSSPFKQWCHVYTLGDGDGNRQAQCWRQRPSPRMFIKSNVGFHGVTIRGLVYFLSGDVFSTHDVSYPCNHRMNNVKTDSIASFDLEKEQWRSTMLRGPPDIITIISACLRILAEINNTLVVMMYDYEQTDMEFWFAEDLEKDLWVKNLVIRRELLEPYPYMS